MNERASLEQTVGISPEEKLAQDLASLEQKNPAAAESIRKALARAGERKQNGIVITQAMRDEAKAIDAATRRQLGEDY